MNREEAMAFHREACVIDLHADTTKLMEYGKYDLAKRHEQRLPSFAYALGHVDLPRARDGGLGAQFFTQWTFPLPQNGCKQSVLRQLAALDNAVHDYPQEIAWAMSEQAVRACHAEGKLAALGGIEGGHALEGDLTNIEMFAQRGVRYLGLMHFSRNEIGSPAKGRGADPTQGLTAFGRDVVRECERTGCIVDLAHINRKGFFEAIGMVTKPPLVSHTGVLGVHEHWRNIDDEQIRAIAQRGGAIGVIFARRFLGGAGIEAVVDHLMHILSVGGEDVAALGSDFDGTVVTMEGLADVADLPNLTAALSQRGVSHKVLAKILGGNVLRVLHDTPPVAWESSRGNA